MTLERYIRSDLVLLPPTATVRAAAMALERSGAGLVLVHDGSALVGVVTPRDLMVRAIARGLDPSTTSLADVMTREVATLPVDASEGEAGRLMLDRRVRRVPLLDGATPVGLVTFDDLALDQDVDASMLSAILRAQLLDTPRPERNGRTRLAASSGAPALA